jgi:acyl-homoserine-lactone acylase
MTARRRTRRPLLLTTLAVAVLAALFGLAAATARGASQAAPAEALPAAGQGATIVWDAWGIPHVRAADAESLFYAYGWAQAHNHPELLLRNFGGARARGAEYWGEDHLADDRWYRQVELPEWTESAYAGLDPEMRGWIDAFAAGAQAYYRQHPDAASPEAARVLPISGRDVMANAGAVGLRFSSARQAAKRWLEAQGGEGGSPHRSAGLANGRPGRGHDAPALRPASISLGSNAWAVGPTKSEDGHAMLLANPHLPWPGIGADDLTWMEAQLTAPGIDVYGASLVGMPVINIGFTSRLGWTHTVNTQDTEDLYELTLGKAPDGSTGYLYDGEVRPFEEHRTVEIAVRTAGGGRRTEKLDLLRSVQGPVIARAGGKALALRRVQDVTGGLGQAFRQWWEMARAHDLAGFEKALERQAVVGQNVTYADADGHIAYFYGAATPKRPSGDAAFWRGVVPGDRSDLVWTEVLPFDRVPRVVDPPSGWVQNANDPPWDATWPPALDPKSFPPYMAPVELPLRPQRSIEMLRESGTLGFEELIRLKHSTRMGLADRVLPELLDAVGAASGGDSQAEARKAARILTAWNRRADSDSRGAVLFDAWARRLHLLDSSGKGFARPWSAADPLATPDGLADPAGAVTALAAAAREVEAAHGRADVTWGEVHRLRLGGFDLPGNGASGALGVFRVAFWSPPGEDGTETAVGGDSFVAAVDFGRPLRAFALIAYGNSTRQGSPHRGDQAGLFASEQLRPVWYTPEEVAAHAVERTEGLHPGSAPAPR